MSQPAHTQTILARISQGYIEAGLLLALASVPEPRISPSTPSPKGRFFAWRSTEGDADHPVTWLTFSLLLPPEPWQANTGGCTTVRLQWHPERHRVLQTGVSVKRHSPVFSLLTLGHSLRCLSRARRRVDVLLRLRRPADLGFQRKNLPAAAALSHPSTQRPRAGDPGSRARFLSSEPPQKAHLGTWERGTSRRFAQECPEGNPGKYKQGETPWHSTKTKSL